VLEADVEPTAPQAPAAAEFAENAVDAVAATSAAVDSPETVAVSPPVESAPMTADLFAGKPVEPELPASPVLAVETVAATPYDIAAQVADPGNGKDEATPVATAFVAATPADEASIAIAQLDEIPAPVARDESGTSNPDARSA